MQDRSVESTCEIRKAAARSKSAAASLLGFGGMNNAGSMDVPLVWMLCVVTQSSLRRADPSSRGVLPRVHVRGCDQTQQSPSTPTMS